MKRIGVLICCVLSLSLLLAGCGKDLPAVYVQSVSDIMGYGAAGEFNVSAGIVTAQNEIKIEKDESRKVSELKIEVGQSVNEGDVLFVYDMEEAKLSLDKAELELEQMKNSVVDLTDQIAELEKEKQYASSADQLSYTVRIQTLETDKKETEYNVTVKEHELESMRNNLGDGKVTSPISGKVKSINQSGGYDDYTGMPLPYITLIGDGAYRVKGSVNELTQSSFFVGQAVVVYSRLDSNLSWHGTIDMVETSPEENQYYGSYYDGPSDDMSASSNYPFYVQLDSTEGLLLGQHVFIEPDGNREESNALWLDASYIIGSEEEGFYVWAADGDEIQKRKIDVGSFDEMLNRYEILSGLSKADLIAFPEENVTEGAPITKTQPVDTAEPMPAPMEEPMPVVEEAINAG